MLIKPNKITEEFHFKLDERDYARHATIIFINNKFDNCSFKTNKKIYDLTDWEFLNKLSGRILELVDQKKREENNNENV